MISYGRKSLAKNWLWKAKRFDSYTAVFISGIVPNRGVGSCVRYLKRAHTSVLYYATDEDSCIAVKRLAFQNQFLASDFQSYSMM